MKRNALYAATLLSALGSGLIAGVFFWCSSFVIKALGKLPPTQDIAAMRSINVEVINDRRLVPVIDLSAACSISSAQFR